MTASETISNIIPGQAPVWALEVSSPQELYLPQKCLSPAVAFSMLSFSPEAVAYIDSITLKDFPTNNFNNYSVQSHGFKVAGWTKDPAHASKARAVFERKAAQFYPDRPGRASMLETLSEGYAALASRLDKRKLSFLLRMNSVNYLPENSSKLRPHRDGTPYTSVIALSDKGTVIYPSTGEKAALPRLALGLWTAEQLHAANIDPQAPRCTIVTSIENGFLDKARPANPNALMKARDWVTNLQLSKYN